MRYSLFVALFVCATFAVGDAMQRAGAFTASRDHAAIAYSTAPVTDAASVLKRKLADNSVQLTYEPVSGYLRSVLQALEIPIESQVLVYSETSFQARRINRRNPRAVFFNDRAAVGWVRGGEILEISAQDPRQATVYYTLEQAENRARLTRSHNCLSCHLSWDTLGVPGPFVLTTHPRRTTEEYANGGHIDHGSPIAERWGGWFVTGARVPKEQLGNLDPLIPNMPASGPLPVPPKASVDGEFDLAGYPTAFSDVVALMVLEHQVQATNLITRAGWEYRLAAFETGAANAMRSPRVREAVDMLVDYFLFVGEAPLPSPIRGTSGFAAVFEAAGRRDDKGRSLRALQLDSRLMRYPCSYMIYSPGFDGLPDEVRVAVYRRITDVLSSPNSAPAYGHLSAADRTAILEILRDTKPDFATRPIR